MPTLHLTNKSTVRKRAGLLARLGIVASLGYSAVYWLPRVWHESHLYDNKPEIYKKAEESVSFKDAVDLFDRSTQGSLLTEGRLVRERNGLYAKITERCLREIEENQRSESYELDGQTLKHCRDANIGAGNLSLLEQKIKEGHPDNIVKRGDQAANHTEQLSLYELAEKEYRRRSMPTPSTLVDKIVQEHLSFIFKEWSVDGVNLYWQLDHLRTYLSDKPDTFKFALPAPEQAKFVQESEKFFREYYARNEPSGVPRYLTVLIDVLQLLDIADDVEHIQRLANIYIDYCQRRVQEEVATTVDALNIAFDLSQQYGLKREKEIIGLYVTRASQEPSVIAVPFLDQAYLKTREFLGGKEHRESLVKIAEGYVAVAQQHGPRDGKDAGGENDALNFLHLAHSLYGITGVPEHDRRVTAVRNLINHYMRRQIENTAEPPSPENNALPGNPQGSSGGMRPDSVTSATARR